ncbi:MAG: ferritin family protein [Chloroflexota bacterium]|nr:ferritin family protein [Chloroflexota bacterium]
MAKRRVDPVDALKLAIERERGANRFYREAADMVEDPNGKRAFQWLAKQELRHVAKLRQQLRSVLNDDTWLEWRRRITPIEKAFSPISEASGDVKVSDAEIDALRHAVQSEKESVTFYREAAENTPDVHGKAMFRALAAEEEQHLALVEEELELVVASRKYITLHRFVLRADR